MPKAPVASKAGAGPGREPKGPAPGYVSGPSRTKTTVDPGNRMRLRPATALLALGVLLTPHVLAAQENDPLEKKAARWMALLEGEHFDSAAAQVSPVAQSSMGPEQLAMIWPQILERFGKLEKTAPLNRMEANGYTVVQLLGTFAKGQQTIRIAFDKDGLVAGFVVLDPRGGGPARRPGSP